MAGGRAAFRPRDPRGRREPCAGRPAEEVLLGDDASEIPGLIDHGETPDLGSQHTLAG
jgi:hypothetical protein